MQLATITPTTDTPEAQIVATAQDLVGEMTLLVAHGKFGEVPIEDVGELIDAVFDDVRDEAGAIVGEWLALTHWLDRERRVRQFVLRVLVETILAWYPRVDLAN